MFYTIDVDYKKCTGCQSCSVACSLKREKISNPLLGRIQVARWEAEGLHVPVVCGQCVDAPCQRVCPVSALSRESASAVIVLDYDRCIGCRMCVLACPFGAMLVHPHTLRVMKCDHCLGEPLCVKVCQNQAIKYVPITEALRAKRITSSRKVLDAISTTAEAPE
jgi:Fe-S-cluster-containing hydrogenase component 2